MIDGVFHQELLTQKYLTEIKGKFIVPKEKIYDYEEIRDELQTFDIINCTYGDQGWNPIHWLLGAIGHTATVYRCRETGQLFVYESTQMGSKDGLSGVQLRPLKEWVNRYRGKIRIRSVGFESSGAFTGHDRRIMAEQRCKQHIRKYRGRAYPNLKKLKGLWFLMNAAIDLPWKSRFRNKDTDTVIFCTMLLFHLFRFCRMAWQITVPSEAEPDDTRPGSDSLLKESLLKHITVGPERRIK